MDYASRRKERSRRYNLCLIDRATIEIHCLPSFLTDAKRRHKDVFERAVLLCLPATPIFSYRVTATLSIRSDAPHPDAKTAATLNDVKTSLLKNAIGILHRDNIRTHKSRRNILSRLKKMLIMIPPLHIYTRARVCVYLY